jgi:phosphatidylinositol-3-phosphatase
VKAAAALALAAAVLAACGSSSKAVSSSFSTAAKRSPSARVVLLVMENKDRGQIIGSADAPYMTALARRYGTAGRSFAITHPSLPNYLALVSGSTHGITSDCTDCRVSGPNLGTQLDHAKLGWKSYQEGLPQPCFTGAAAGRYARKHDPFAYWGNRDCRHRVSFDVLKADLAAGRLPPFSLVVPDLCHDMHDCSVATGDRFLKALVPKLLRGLGPRGYLVLTFDESNATAPIATVVAGPGARRRAVHPARVDHYGVLATIEDTFGLPRLGAAAGPGHGSLRPLLRQSAARRSAHG